MYQKKVDPKEEGMVVDMAQFETGELRQMVLVLQEKPVVSIQSLFDTCRFATNSNSEATQNFQHFKII